MVKIYHNPRCSKSREALAVVEQYCQRHGMPLEIIKYLENSPTKGELALLLEQLGTPPEAMVRQGEDEYKAMGLSPADSKDKVLDAIAACPKLLQRPIVVYREKALIARPPELLHDFLR
ncbi:arsenate reductase (glutaredoxin) [Noviherbaspirillum malthae]|uniref:arsenate reductase (glutaredoxin) n=1 Tax=Noviherbaspirillum malthae TaxID=1260987 RepID=UPI00188EACBD|nr:arsenate reductase (glutaredoxin) [Noviherbaspirillum malthae]